MTRALAVDWGTARLGMAVSEGVLARGLPTLVTSGYKESLELITQTAREHQARTIILGLPMLPSGSEGDSARRARKLGSALSHRGFEVKYRDERWTTAEALEKLHQRGAKPEVGDADRVAAAILLQDYLDELGSA